MPCFSPMSAWQDARSGQFVFSQDSTRELGPTISVPCRLCVGCRADLAAEKTLRCVHEASLYAENCFLTLTVDDAHFPSSEVEWRSSFDKGLKRIRHLLSPKVIRTFGCRELGDSTFRPHGHLLVFGARFELDGPLARSAAGWVCHESLALTKAWGLGHVSVGEFSPESAGYVARYTMKKRPASDPLGELVEVVHPLTGEIVALPPSRPWAVSRRPGIGAEWFSRFGMPCVEQGFVVSRGGSEHPLPSYYKRLGKRVDPLAGSEARAAAAVVAIANSDNRTPERLAVRRAVFVGRTRDVKRGSL